MFNFLTDSSLGARSRLGIRLERGEDGVRRVPLYLMLLMKREAAPRCVHMELFKYSFDKHVGAYNILFKVFTTEAAALDMHADLEKLPLLALPDDIVDRSELFHDVR